MILVVVAETCDDVAVMYAGRIVEQASAVELFSHPLHPYTIGLPSGSGQTLMPETDHHWQQFLEWFRRPKTFLQVVDFIRVAAMLGNPNVM